MKKPIHIILPLALMGITCLFSSCSEDKVTDPEPVLRISFAFDETQPRLNNLGDPASIPAGNAAQTPNFHGISAHYVELSPDRWTPLGAGAILYKGEETTAAGDTAVDFSKAIVVDEGETFLEIPLSQIASDEYEWVRVSLTYQNYDIELSAFSLMLSTRVSSFVGFNTYITNHQIKDSTLVVNASKKQGYGALESSYGVVEWQAPPGATTVPNPLFATSPVPQGSCVVTGSFSPKFEIKGDETEDIELVLSLTVNNSFEWEDNNSNDKYEPLSGEDVVDMGLRGLIPIIQ